MNEMAYEEKIKRTAFAVAELLDRVDGLDEVQAVTALTNVIGSLIAQTAKSQAEAEQRLSGVIECIRLTIDEALPSTDGRQ